jgi:CrcB protein
LRLTVLQLFAIAVGGAIGAVLRFGLSTSVYRWLGRDFPYGTLTVNVLGSLLVGFLATLLIDRLMLSVEWRTAILVGFIGAFTTFSTFSLETLALMENGEPLRALLNILLSVVLCLSATWIGLTLGRQL